MSPVNVNLSRDEQHRFDGPIRSFEVQQGEVQVRFPNGRSTRPTAAGKEIPGGDLGGAVLTALKPSIVRVTSTSEAEVAEKHGQRQASRQAKAAAQGQDAPLRTKPPLS